MKKILSEDRCHLMICALVLLFASAFHLLYPADDGEQTAAQVFLTVAGYDGEEIGEIREVADEPDPNADELYSGADEVVILLRELTDER